MSRRARCASAPSGQSRNCWSAGCANINKRSWTRKVASPILAQGAATQEARAIRILRGTFITFEGGEGAGKSTQVKRLADTLRAARHDVLVTREPGGSPGAEAVRHVLLSGAAERFGPSMEALLFAAARSDHVEQVIRPAIEAGRMVLCDRFLDSTRVYQGVTGGLDLDYLASLEAVAINGMMPDITVILDIDPRVGLSRAEARRGSGDADRFERESVDIHARRREAYLAIASREPERCVVIDATPEPTEIARAVAAAVLPRLLTKARRGGDMKLFRRVASA